MRQYLMELNKEIHICIFKRMWVRLKTMRTFCLFALVFFKNNVLTLVCEGGVDFGDKGHWWVLALGTGCDWNVGLLGSHT